VPVIFTYSRANCPCDVTTFLDLTSFRLLIGLGRDRSGHRVKCHWVGSGHGSKILTRFHLCHMGSAGNMYMPVSKAIYQNNNNGDLIFTSPSQNTGLSFVRFSTASASFFRSFICYLSAALLMCVYVSVCLSVRPYVRPCACNHYL